MSEINNNDESEMFLELGGKPEEATVGLRIFGDDHEPGEITQLLNYQPTEAFRKGQVVTNKIRSRTIETGKWFLNIEKNKTQTLEEQISKLLEKTA